MWTWDSKFFAGMFRVFTFLSLVMVGVTALTGEFRESLLFVLAAAVNAWFAHYWSDVAARKRRHSMLKAKRLARERGTTER
jgi:hypothetical protein